MDLPQSAARRLRQLHRRRARACAARSSAATRKTVVFGPGNADAELMFVGEAPGASEDEQGLPFVGARGQAPGHAARGRSGWSASEVFAGTCSSAAPRQPRSVAGGDRELQEYLLRQVELIEPTVICTLGELLHQAAARRPDRHHAPARPARGDARWARARSACTRSTTRPRRCTRRACCRRCVRTSRACRSCSRWRRPSSPAAGCGGRRPAARGRRSGERRLPARGRRGRPAGVVLDASPVRRKFPCQRRVSRESGRLIDKSKVSRRAADDRACLHPSRSE